MGGKIRNATEVAEPEGGCVSIRETGTIVCGKGGFVDGAG
jgi:hypothetical protein